MEDNEPIVPITAEWVTLPPEREGEVSLRSWWARPLSTPLRGVLVLLPEIFGLNPWVCAVAERWAARGYGVLAIPLFARTAPGLSLGYGPEEVLEGRSHKERTTAATLRLDVARAMRWLKAQSPPEKPLPVGCIGFCFGGHVALLASTLEGMEASCVCYGAGVVQGRPGGGPPTLGVLSEAGGRVLLIYGSEDPLVPAEDLHAISQAVECANAGGDPRRAQLQLFAAGHGFLCEARDDFRSEQAREAWASIRSFLAETLG